MSKGRNAELLDRVDAAVLTVDEDWTVTYCNDRVEAVLGRTPAVVTGETVWEALDASVGSRIYDALQDAARDDTDQTFETRLGRDDRWFEVSVYPDTPDLMVTVREITEPKRQEQALSGVLETTRALMQGRTREEVGELVASAAENTLGFEYAVVRLYDADTETLEPVGRTTAVETDLPEPAAYGLDDAGPGEAFASGERRVEAGDGDPIASTVHLPIGVHGTLSVGSADSAGFDAVEQNLAEILATNAAVAFGRAKREQEARDARDRVETLLARINGLVRDTLEVLVTATTREEIETGVCEALTAADPYRFAWVGGADLSGETLSASAWNGTEAFEVRSYDRAVTGGGELDASARALRDGTRQVVGDLGDSDLEWERRAADAGLASMCAVPLIDRETTYGVLSVYADRPDAFDEREQAVLAALGRAIGDAINAIERGRILETNRVVEMELTSRDSGLLFSRLSAAADCRIESTGAITRSGDTLRLYLTAETTDHEAVLSAARDDEAVTEITHVVTQEGTALFDLTVSESVVDRLAEFGAVTNRIVGEGGQTRLTIELPHEAEAREVYDLLDDAYEDVDLASYHEHDRPVQTRQEFRAALRDRFTDRQETALRSAYLGGFFEWPRDVDGDELAAAMGITRPTYHQHLRTAERKVFEELFE